MYPSSDFPYYGTFIKELEDALLLHGTVQIDKIVITKTENYFFKAMDYILFFFKVIFAMSKSNRYDIIHVHFLNHTLIPFYFLPKNSTTKWVFNGHGSDVFPEKRRGDFLGAITKKVISRADSVIVPSGYFKKEVVQKYNLDPSKVFVSASGGVSTDTFPFKEEMYQDQKVIGFFGRLEENKGISLFLDSISKIKTQNIKFKIAGTGSLSGYVEQRIEGDLANFEIEFLGPIPKSKVPDFFQDVDLFLFLSDRKGESLGLTAIEALASGCPIIGLERGAINDFLFHGENGYLIKENDPNQIGGLVDYFFNLDKIEVQRMRKRSREVAINYDSSSLARELIKYYHQLKNSK